MVLVAASRRGRSDGQRGSVARRPDSGLPERTPDGDARGPGAATQEVARVWSRPASGGVHRGERGRTPRAGCSTRAISAPRGTSELVRVQRPSSWVNDPGGLSLDPGYSTNHVVGVAPASWCRIRTYVTCYGNFPDVDSGTSVGDEARAMLKRGTFRTPLASTSSGRRASRSARTYLTCDAGSHKPNGKFVSTGNAGEMVPSTLSVPSLGAVEPAGLHDRGQLTRCAVGRGLSAAALPLADRT